MTERLVAVTGRFQPVHDQHLELFDLALRDADHLVVAVTNPDPGARHTEPTSAHRHTPGANPFTYLERARMLAAALAGAGLADRATVVPFDLTRPEVWPDYVPAHARHVVRAYSDWERTKAARIREGGYAVTVLDGDPAAKRDAIDVRAALLAGNPAPAGVPLAVRPVLAALLAERSMADRSNADGPMADRSDADRRAADRSDDDRRAAERPTGQS